MGYGGKGKGNKNGGVTINLGSGGQQPWQQQPWQQPWNNGWGQPQWGNAGPMSGGIMNPFFNQQAAGMSMFFGGGGNTAFGAYVWTSERKDQLEKVFERLAGKKNDDGGTVTAICKSTWTMVDSAKDKQQTSSDDAKKLTEYLSRLAPLSHSPTD